MAAKGKEVNSNGWGALCRKQAVLQFPRERFTFRGAED